MSLLFFLRRHSKKEGSRLVDRDKMVFGFGFTRLRVPYIKSALVHVHRSRVAEKARLDARLRYVELVLGRPVRSQHLRRTTPPGDHELEVITQDAADGSIDRPKRTVAELAGVIDVEIFLVSGIILVVGGFVVKWNDVRIFGGRVVRIPPPPPASRKADRGERFLLRCAETAREHDAPGRGGGRG